MSDTQQRPDTQAIIPSTSGAPSGLLAILVHKRSALSELPYDREILLLECDIAGTSYIKDVDALDPELKAGACLTCVREPGNRHDAMAIRLQTDSGRKAGYIPRANNEVIARLMDAGKLILTRVESKAWIGSWLKVSIQVLLRDF